MKSRAVFLRDLKKIVQVEGRKIDCVQLFIVDSIL